MAEIKTTHNVTTVKTEKFKTTLIKVSFKSKLKRETITARTLLPSVLRRSSQAFPSRKELNAHLENLYGASLSIATKKQGALHVVSFYIQVTNEKFLTSAPPLFEEALKTMEAIIFSPNFIDDHFDPEVVTLEKRLLKEDIEAIYDDKTTYALKKMLSYMCESEGFGVNGDGYVEDLANIDEKTLVDTYRAMLNEDEQTVRIVGDVEHDDVLPLFKAHFNSKSERGLSSQVVDQEEKELRGVTDLVEKQEISQTKLNIGYRTHTRVTDPDYFALLVFNGIFGAFAHSKLFTNVREKESLCYYCGAQLDNFKGLMYVYSGLDLTQVEKATAIIDQQLSDVVDGNVTETELLLAKKSIVNAKRESLDSATGFMADLEMGELLGMSADEFVQKVEAITLEEVMAVAKKIKKDTVFVLEGSVNDDGS